VFNEVIFNSKVLQRKNIDSLLEKNSKLEKTALQLEIENGKSPFRRKISSWCSK